MSTGCVAFRFSLLPSGRASQASGSRFARRPLTYGAETCYLPPDTSSVIGPENHLTAVNIGFSDARIASRDVKIAYTDANFAYTDANLAYTDANFTYTDSNFAYTDANFANSDVIFANRDVIFSYRHANFSNRDAKILRKIANVALAALNSARIAVSPLFVLAKIFTNRPSLMIDCAAIKGVAFPPASPNSSRSHVTQDASRSSTTAR